MIATITITTSLLATLASAPPYVLAVGVNQPPDAELTPLKFADDDAAEAIKLFGASVSRAWLHTVMDADSQRRHPALVQSARPPTLASLRDSVAEIALRIDADRARSEQSVVVIWISGHAARDADGHVTFPLQQQRITGTTLVNELIAPLQRAHRVHMIVDTCFAAALLRTEARATVKTIPAAQARARFFAQGLTAWPNVGAVVGTSPSQRGYEWSAIGAGVFSAMVRAGMRGAADANGDDMVVYSELAAFLSAAAQAVEIGEARPQIQVHQPVIELDAPLSRRAWLGETALLSGDLAAYGPFHVLDDRGTWLMAAAFEHGFSPRLWLPRDRPLYLRSGETERPIEHGDETLVLRAPVVSETTTRSLVGNALQRGLFQTPYGPAYYRGFSAARTSARANTGKPPTPDPVPFAAYACFGGAALVGLGAIAAGALACEGAIAYSTTDLERPAHQAWDRMLLWSGIGAAGLVVGAGLAVTGWLQLEPEAAETSSSQTSQP